MFPGGIAGKLGNRFEAKWTVQKCIEVFVGQADSIRFESINPADHGVEFSLSRGQFKEWHQTKRQETNGNWTVNRLEKEGVLSSALKKLTANSDDVFVFVSEASAKGVHDLPGKAVIAQSWKEFDEGLSEEQRKEFAALSRVWKAEPEQAWLYIKRCRFEVVSDASLDTHIRLFSGFAFNEPPNTIFPILREYLESNFNRELRTEDIRKELIEDKSVTPRALYDPTLRERVAQATQRYLQSYAPFGFGDETISRAEAKEVIDLISKEDGPNVVLLTGSAGSGKSGVVREVISQLADLGISHLAFRVDRNLSIRSSSELGQTLISRQEDPVVTLALLKRDEKSILIIDQIDAVSEASGRVGPMREVIFELLEAARASKYVRVLAICRSFDLTNDQTLRTLEQSKKVCRVEVNPLDWEQEVKPLLLQKSVDTDKITDA